MHCISKFEYVDFYLAKTLLFITFFEYLQVPPVQIFSHYYNLEVYCHKPLVHLLPYQYWGVEIKVHLNQHQEGVVHPHPYQHQGVAAQPHPYQHQGVEVHPHPYQCQGVVVHPLPYQHQGVVVNQLIWHSICSKICPLLWGVHHCPPDLKT